MSLNFAEKQQLLQMSVTFLILLYERRIIENVVVTLGQSNLHILTMKLRNKGSNITVEKGTVLSPFGFSRKCH